MPPIPFAEKMATKSNVAVLDVMEEDPATNHGALQVCLKLMSHVPTISNCGEIHQKTMVAGDQGVAERFRTRGGRLTSLDASFARCFAF